VKTYKYRIIIRNILPDVSVVHGIVRQELGKVEIVDWKKEGEVNFQGDCGAGSQRHIYVMVKYRELPKKPKKGGCNKRPAHEIVLEEFKKLVNVFVCEGGVFEPTLNARYDELAGILKNMIIPKEHVQEIVDDLRQMKDKARELTGGTINLYLPESLFEAIKA
jgi:hypothetical protein